MTPEEATQKLFEAAKKGNVSDAQEALDAGADVNAKDDHQMTPLHWAAGFGHTDVVRLLIKKVADINAEDNKQWTPLHLAAISVHTDTVRLLIEKGANPNTKDRYQRTPLRDAILYGHQDIIRLLQEAQKTSKQTPGHGGDGNPHASRVTKERGAGGGKEVER